MPLQANKLYKVIQRKVFSKEECEKILSVETTPAPYVTYNHYAKLNIIVQNEENKWIRDRIEKINIEMNDLGFESDNLIGSIQSDLENSEIPLLESYSKNYDFDFLLTSSF